MSIKISGTVVKGLGLGKKLGFPTINMDAALAPKALLFGVYAVRVNVSRKTREKTCQKTFAGAMHFGPSFAHGRPGATLEVHCFGLEDELYGELVEVEIVKKLRDVRNFKNEEDFKKAIRADIAKAKKIL